VSLPTNPPHFRPAVLRYDRVAIALHWITALLIVVVGVLGLLHDSWPRRTQAFWINLHALIGLSLWALVVVRLWWRLGHPPPAPPAQTGILTHRLAHAVHLLLYLLVLVIPLVGIVTFVWHGRAFDFGLFKVDFGVHSNRAIFHPTEDIHGYLAYVLFTLVGLHLLAALWHQFVRRDRLIQRMWPAASRGSAGRA
jgi:cytochrome b561